MHIACASSEGSDCFEILLQFGALINARSAIGRTPLHMTAIHGRFTLSKRLLDVGASNESQDNKGNTALHFAAW